MAGTLDILAAVLLTLIYGADPLRMLRRVGSGAFPDAPQWGLAGSAAGLLVHYALMAVMAAAFVLAADRMPALKRRPLLWGILYGLVTYVVMNLIVVPWRFARPLPADPVAIGTQLFCHIVLVGIPIALIARRGGAARD